MTAEAPEHPDEKPPNPPGRAEPEAPDPPDAAEPEVPDRPLGVPAEADEEDDQPPGFQRDPPNAG
jgi:hypothetical protein